MMTFGVPLYAVFLRSKMKHSKKLHAISGKQGKVKSKIPITNRIQIRKM